MVATAAVAAVAVAVVTYQSPETPQPARAEECMGYPEEHQAKEARAPTAQTDTPFCTMVLSVKATQAHWSHPNKSGCWTPSTAE